MLLLSVTVLLIPALCTAANPPGYGWSPYVYGGGNSYGGYQQQLYGGYQQQPYGGYSNYHYSQSNSHGYTPSWSGIAYGFRNYVYPAYQYLPSVGSLLKSGAYGALKGAGVGAAVGGIAGIIG